MIDLINHISIKQVSLVGAGPGGVEYLTLKALKALSFAEVILYDDIIKSLLSELTTPGAELIDVGKRLNDGINQEERQQIINQLILKYYKAGKRIVRLKGGDPMLFGKIYEEINFLNSQDVDFEIIPGISAGQAGAALFKIPLTIRDKASELVILTAQKVNKQDNSYAGWVSQINTGTPFIVYMGGTRLSDIAHELLKNYAHGDIQVSALSNVGTFQQKIYSATLSKIAEGNSPDIPLPAVLIIGKYALPKYLTEIK